MLKSDSASTFVGAFVAAAVTMFAADTSAQQLRFSTTLSGGIAATGNTLGLSKALNENGPGLQDSIGTFVTLDASSIDDQPFNPSNPWMLGTTPDWTANASAAVLALPVGAEIMYAELVWAGSSSYGEDVTLFLDDPITLSTGSDSIAVTPDPATAIDIAEQSYTGFFANYYIRSAEVTDFVSQYGAGEFIVSGVPATQTTTINSLNAAGWTLIVAYRGGQQPIRNMSIFVGGSFVDEDSQQDYSFSGFCAPPTGAVEGNVVVTALEGDADLVGDDLQIAESDVGPFYSLVGPNNPSDNFFCSQLNDHDGLLDTQGTFGGVNHDAFNGLTVPGGRQGWDLTTIALSSMAGQLSNSQIEAVIRTTTTGDSYVPSGVAFEIDVKSPDLADATSVAEPNPVEIGDTITFTATLPNVGEAPASSLVFVMPVEPGLELSSFTTDGVPGDINGTPVTEADLQSGIPQGDLPVGSTRTIEAIFEVVGEPQNGTTFAFGPLWHHSFVVCDGDPPIDDTHTPPRASVEYLDGGTGSGGATGAGGATSSGSGSTASGNGNNGDNTSQDQGSCACTTPGQAPNKRDLAWLILASAAIALRRQTSRKR